MFNIDTTILVFIFSMTSSLSNHRNNEEAAAALKDYFNNRETFIKLEESHMLGSTIILNQQEQMVNKILMGYKLSEYDAGFKDPGVFAPAQHFFHARKDIEKSEVFKMIQKMPKGAALHAHDTALVSEEYQYNLTYKDNLYACTVDEKLNFKFLIDAQQDKTRNWTLISVLRKQDPAYDDWVRSKLTFNVENPRETYSNINVVWKVFINLFETVEPMITYKPVFKEYLYQALKELYEDNVMYLEFRAKLVTVYELNGTEYGPIEVAKFYQEVIDQFKSDYPDFLGARLIYCPLRKVNNATANNYVEIVKDLKKYYPNLLAGFDMAGQEDLGEPLSSFILQLQEIASNGIDFFFHAAETKWHGTSSDFNLIDAVLLGTKRIGHGFVVTKHPLVMKAVKERQIAIEVSPISNQVLTLVDEMRNHPAAHLIADGFPVVISYDDPTFWSTKGLSYDFYMAFMGIASRNADLRLLKQLAKNSLLYSAMPAEEKELALQSWETQWEKFIDVVVKENPDASW